MTREELEQAAQAEGYTLIPIAPAEPRELTLRIRVNDYQHDIMKQAAKEDCVTLSQFILRSAMQKAKEILGK